MVMCDRPGSFSHFCRTHFGTEGASNPEMPTNAEKNAPAKLLSAKGRGQGQPSRTGSKEALPCGVALLQVQGSWTVHHRKPGLSLPPGYSNDPHPLRPKTFTPTQQSENSLSHIQTSES